jgi:hypothetical protein
MLYEVLKRAALAFPAVFETTEFGDSADEFKKQYPDVLPRFEAARMNSHQLSEVAAVMSEAARSVIKWRSAGTELPLAEHVRGPASPLRLESRRFGDTGGLQPRLGRDRDALAGVELVRHAQHLVVEGLASAEVAEGIGWLVDRADADGLDLRNRRVVLLGAGAELAPARLLLEGGATVLWIDVIPPPADLVSSNDLRGAVYWAPEGADLLAEPHRIRATIEVFAGGNAVDIGLYAYAPGRTREWRLTAAMNAIVDALPAQLVRTITMLISPTTCGVLSAADVEGERHRRESRPGWQSLLARIGALGRGPGHARIGDVCTNRGIVPIQGTSYAAAQYLGKVITAEAWAAGDARHHVSANTAGISRTVSMSHPVFDAAFAGAEVFGIETFDPASTATLNGLLAVRDWLDPASPGNPAVEYATPRERALAVTSTRIHGGIYQLPYPLASALRVAAAMGAARDPRRLGPMMRRR